MCILEFWSCYFVKLVSSGNKYDFDLNRNFPDYFVNNQVKMQPETIAIMNWLNSLQFVLSATLHGGALLVNYPYDNLKKEGWSEIILCNRSRPASFHLNNTLEPRYNTVFGVHSVISVITE